MQKMKSKKGFTLIEMLIVVGIIAILVAVSIPMVNSSLEKAKRATDAANERAAKAAVMVEYLTNNTDPMTKQYYNAETGQMSNKEPAGYGRCSLHKDAYLQVKSFDKATGELNLVWSGDNSQLHNLNTDTDPAAPGAGTG